VSLKDLIRRADLNQHQRAEALMTLAQTSQSSGMHKEALSILADIPDDRPGAVSPADIWRDLLRAISRSALGDPSAAEALGKLANDMEVVQPNPMFKGAILLEAGKASEVVGDTGAARRYWERAAAIFKGLDAEHHARTMSNLASLRLQSADAKERERGVSELQEATDIKARIGDWHGMSTNCSILGLHYWRYRKFDSALGYLRRDLALTRRIGHQRELGTTLGNLGALYADLKQFTLSRRMLREAGQIADALHDGQLGANVAAVLERTEGMARAAGEACENVGATAQCACGSGARYDVCCGRADHEPVDLPWTITGPSEDVVELARSIEAEGRRMERLDVVLRHSEKVRERMAWNQILPHGGWFEMRELPDVANLHLRTARLIADLPEHALAEVGGPLASAVMAVSATEAFINQVAYFVGEHNRLSSEKIEGLAALDTDIGEFERKTELTEKWRMLGSALSGGEWPDPALWQEFRQLVRIRNELVHFKTVDYEQVVPPPKSPHEMLRGLPSAVELRDTPHSWPYRLLTPSLARWSVSVSERMIQSLRLAYGARQPSRKS